MGDCGIRIEENLAPSLFPLNEEIEADPLIVEKR
jgi:hypothetical protein